MKKDKPLKTSWEKKMKSKQTTKYLKDMEKELKAQRSERLKEKRERAALNKKKREENQRKSEVVQVVSIHIKSLLKWF